VRGHYGLHMMLVEPKLEADEQGIAGGAVKGRKRLVEEQKPRLGSQRTGESHALRFAAREILRTAVEQVCCVHQLQHFPDSLETRGTVKPVQPIRDIGLDAEMREESGLLSDHRSLTASGFEAETAGRISEQIAVEGNVCVFLAAGICQVEPGEKAKQRTFSRARGTEDDGPLGGESALDLQMKAAAAGVEGQLKHDGLHESGRPGR